MGASTEEKEKKSPPRLSTEIKGKTRKLSVNRSLRRAKERILACRWLYYRMAVKLSSYPYDRPHLTGGGSRISAKDGWVF